jgi:DNA-binding NarL/FixJ family response regulator
MESAVVIIEDSEPSLRRLEAAVTGTPGLTVGGSAATPGKAIELISALRPAILILDLFLDGGTGVEVLRAIRERGLDTRVIVVTNAPSAALSKHCRDLGARFFFDKAIEFDQFEDALRALQAEVG